ncbi:hypothetical protein C0992_006461 [Termitomyces sp. T32_za158]|nr:hypothetical protein C0992_006461 [Termitomyces sp. T32_za158]
MTGNRYLDVLIVGAGFSGIYQLHKLRKAGFAVKLFEAGGGLGGIWYWNRYPGAHVDSDFSIYQLSLEELWKDWNWKDKFPGRQELIEYFNYIDTKLGLSRDISFKTRVSSASFNTATNCWLVSTDTAVTINAHFLILCTGFAAKPLFPDIPGLQTFKGVIHHTSSWKLVLTWVENALALLEWAPADVLANEKANIEVYTFWRKRVLERVRDPEMQRKLGPKEQPHPIGAKRISLEQSHYEVFNQPNVVLVDLNENPIVEVTSKGVKTRNGVVHELDVLVLATGFDALTGSISQIEIKGMDGTSIGDKWKNGLSTYLGMTVSGYLNMFFPYGPQAPTPLCNGLTCAVSVLNTRLPH